jgi:hypothetical protein
MIDFSLAVLAGMGITMLGNALPKHGVRRSYIWIALSLGLIGPGSLMGLVIAAG